MSNGNTSENKDLDPVVQAVVNALNDRSKFQPSYIRQNLAEEVEQVEELFDNNTIVVDIYEENGRIVGIDNGVIFSNDDLPGLDYLEAYYGAKYVEDMINESIDSIELLEAAAAASGTPTKKSFFGIKKDDKGLYLGKQRGRDKPKVKTPEKPTATGKKPTTVNTNVTLKSDKKIKLFGRDEKGFYLGNKRGRDNATADDLQPVTVTGKRSASQTPPADDLQPVTVTGERSASQTPPRGGDAPAPGDAGGNTKPTKPGFFKGVGNFLNDTEVGQGLKKTVGDALIGGIGSKLTGGRFSDGAKAGAAGSLVNRVGKAAYDDATGQDDDDDSDRDARDSGTRSVGRNGSSGGSSGGTRGVAPAASNLKVNYSIDDKSVNKSDYQANRADLDQDVVFNVKNSKTGQRRQIKDSKGVDAKGDAEYNLYMSKYRNMKSVVQEALVRMGAVLTEEGWMLNDEPIKSVEAECNLGNIESPYFYDATGRLRIMTESDWVNLSLAEAVVERLIAESMDEVGEEDEDVDNDGDMDKTDDYLHNRRKAIAASIKAKGKK